MPSPVTVSIEVPQSRETVFDYLDVLANHESFTDHMLTEWRPSGPEKGVGAKTKVTNVAANNEIVDIEVIEAERPKRIVERNLSANGKRLAQGTYELTPSADGTRITFTFAWIEAPLRDRLLSPLVRKVLARGNEQAMKRLAENLGT